MPVPREGFELCHPRDPSAFEVVNSLVDGNPRSGSWVPLGVQIVNSEYGKHLHVSNAPWMTAGCLVFDQRALDKIGSVLLSAGELLPLDCSERNVWAFNPTAVLPCLDEASSSVLRTDSGRIFHVSKYSMKEDVVAGHLLYKCDAFRVSPVFMNQGFIDAWHSADLAGLEFDQVWSNE